MPARFKEFKSGVRGALKPINKGSMLRTQTVLDDNGVTTTTYDNDGNVRVFNSRSFSSVMANEVKNDNDFMLMFGNLLKECGVTERLSDTAQNALSNIVTIMLGLTVGATADGNEFIKPRTILIVVLGLLAFAFSTAGGVLLGKVLYLITGGKINPLIGAAGVSAVPMAARVAQVEGRKYNPTNFLLMHAMGPNVAGVIGSAVAAGFMLLLFGNGGLLV